MKKKLRHITIENRTYNYVTSDFSLKIFNDNKSNEFVQVTFDTSDDLYLGSLIYSGHFKTYKNGEEIILNINMPSFVKEIILFLDIAKYDFDVKKQYIIDNGLNILEKIGYDIRGLENKPKKGTKEEDLKSETLHKVLLALKQQKFPLATALVYDALDCTLMQAKNIAENIRKRIV